SHYIEAASQSLAHGFAFFDGNNFFESYGVQNARGLLQPDGVHPTQSGSEVIAKGLWSFLDPFSQGSTVTSSYAVTSSYVVTAATSSYVNNGRSNGLTLSSGSKLMLQNQGSDGIIYGDGGQIILQSNSTNVTINNGNLSAAQIGANTFLGSLYDLTKNTSSV